MKSFKMLENQIKEEILQTAEDRGLKTDEEINKMIYDDFFSNALINYERENSETLSFEAESVNNKIYVNVWNY